MPYDPTKDPFVPPNLTQVLDWYPYDAPPHAGDLDRGALWCYRMAQMLDDYEPFIETTSGMGLSTALAYARDWRALGARLSGCASYAARIANARWVRA